MMKCRCNKCGKEVDYKTRFVAEDGRILCNECSEGVAPAPIELLAKLEILAAIDENLGVRLEDLEDLKTLDTTDDILYGFSYRNRHYKAVNCKAAREVKIKEL